jgi:tetratricopeptide (TPR) repeat protein
MLTPEMILDLLSDRLGLLVGGPRDLPERQQTLRNTLEWSIHLLSDDLKILFARLGVFVGGFTLEAATVICARGLRGDVDVFEGISGLLDNSLIRMENVASIGPRFRMLETIRDYALKLLDEGDERRALKEQHAQFYAEKSSLAGSMYLTEEADFWLDWMGVEHDNMRATLSWFLAEPAGQDFSPWLLASMLWFWYRRGFFIEGQEWCERLLNSPVADASEEARGLALFGSGAMAMWQGDLIHALIFIDRAVEILRRAEDPYMMATVLLFSGTARVNHGDDEEGMVPLAEALEIFKELEMQWYQAITLIHMGNASLGMNNSLRAQQYLEQAHELGRRIGERWLLSLVLNNYGEVARVKGDYSQASEYYEESESLLREMGDKGDLARLVHNLGSVNLRLGNLERARSLLSESIEMFRKLNNQRGLSECLATMAGLWIERSNLRRAASLLSAADMMLKTTGGAWWPADRVEVERNLQAIHDHLNEVDYSQSWQLGQEMTLDEAISLAFNVDAESNGH